MNLFDVLRSGHAEREARTVLRTTDRAVSWTWQDLDLRSAAWAHWLGAEGVEPGDRVLVQIQKSMENVALYLGCLRAGAVFVTLNTSYVPAEVAYFVEDAEPALVFCDPEAPIAAPCPVWTMDGDGNGPASNAVKEIEDPLLRTVERNDLDPACMLYTSGTTGRSKGAVLTHGMLAANAQALVGLWAMTDRDVLLHTLPIFHVHGLFIALHSALIAGAEMVFLPRFNVEATIEALPQATVLMGVPTHYTRLLADARFDRERCAGMRLFTSGSAPMTVPTHEEFAARTGQTILERYGMTETGIITSNPLDGERLQGTVGFALPGFELRITDDDGDEVPVGDTGGVELRCSQLFSGYHNKPDKTAESYRPDGWFRTGDVGRLDSEGRLTLEGRSSDMIISGGLNVYPKEVELALIEHPQVSEAAVVGVPHPDFGEAVIAVVAGDAPSEELDALVAESLASFKRPKRWFHVDALPRNAMGKVQKNVLRSDHAALFKS